MANELELTVDQKAKIHQLYDKTPDLILITREVFGNDALDGRSMEGRAVRKFLIDQGLKYRTTKREKVKEIILSGEQKKFISQNCGEMSAFHIAKVLFPHEKIVSPLNKECTAVIEFIRENEPDKIKSSESAIGVEYQAPATISEAVGIINKVTASELNFKKLSAQNRQSVQEYIRFINSPRVIQIISSYTDTDDRKLFESEFTRFTWDKPDLTADDIALYISVCQDIVMNKRLMQHTEKLNILFENASDQENQDLSIRLADTIKTKSEEYDKVQKRIESVLKKLNGDRGERLKRKGQNTANFLALVEAFQEEEERKRMLLIAKAKREEIKNEADRLESIEDFKARILGISKEEVL